MQFLENHILPSHTVEVCLKVIFRNVKLSKNIKF